MIIINTNAYLNKNIIKFMTLNLKFFSQLISHLIYLIYTFRMNINWLEL